jgi:phage tail sheath gpL-like
MASLSTAIGTERLSRTSGYEIKKGFFTNETQNLPQIIAIFAEANTANQSSISSDKRELTSSDEAGRIYGYGSPIHQIMRILRPFSDTGVGGIPTIVFPQLSEVTFTSTVFEFTITGNATQNATHIIRVAGRETLDFKPYLVNISKGDTPTIMAQKYADVINDNLSSPVTALAALSVLTLETKWKGKTSSDLKVSIDNNGQPAGITYAKTTETLGVGTPSLISGLEQIGSDWVTTVVNSYGEDALLTFEQFNGTPSASSPTGRFEGSIFKPFMAFFGSTESDKEVLSFITNKVERINQVTNVLCPAPASEGFPFEAAANVARLFARTMQDTPEIDINDLSYPDMPAPKSGNIGDMSDYNNRDFLIKKGCSTVILDKNKYVVQDLVTTYHPEGETPLQFNYCRNMNLDWSVADSYRTLERIRLRDKVIIRDNQVTDSRNAIKPKEWKAVLFELFDNLARKGLINEPEFSKESLQVAVSTINPNRFETFFRYKRTGIARIVSTTAEAGF